MGKNKYSRVLVIRLSALGDVAMTVPVLRAFNKLYPDTHITVLTRPFFKPIFEDLDNVSVFEADVKKEYKGVRGLWKLYKALKLQNFEAVADLHNVLRTNILKGYFSLGNTPFVQIDKGRTEKKALTRASKKDFRPLKSTFERYADVFRDLGFELDLVHASAKPRWSVPSGITELLGRDSSKWIGVAPFAAFEGKMYPLSHLESVIEHLNNTKQYKILLFGGGSHEERQLAALARKYEQAVNMAGLYPFKDELALISNLDLMISMDSGNAHLSAMYGIPTITLWGVTHPYAGFYPYGQDPDFALLADRDKYPLIPTSVYGNKCPKGYENAITTITPQDILDKIEAVLHIS